MRTFACNCGQRVFFENSACVKCSLELGFFVDSLKLASLAGGDETGWFQSPTGGRARKCARYGWLCNWMVDESEADELCRACRLNQVEPDCEPPSEKHHIATPSETEKVDSWRAMETAKRRLLFTLYELGLEVKSKAEDSATGLAFALAASTKKKPVLTGHEEGLITLNLAEGNSVTRERTRLTLGENYRTVLGHFRHEIGHYFWDRLVRGQDTLTEFRQLFGDESADYAKALEKHYETPAPFDSGTHVTPYATAHPWEDFAETWAHYLHLMDTWETAQEFGVSPREGPLVGTPFEHKLGGWTELMLALNSLNRSMGQPDAYPFAIGQGVANKLAFVERLITGAAHLPLHLTAQTEQPPAAIAPVAVTVQSPEPAAQGVPVCEAQCPV